MVVTVLASSAVCLAGGRTIYKINMLAMTVSVFPNPFHRVQAIIVDLDNTSKDASMLLLLSTVLSLKQVSS